MKITVAQIHSIRGAIETNIQKHLALIQLAAQHQTEVLFFPELSITSYEPSLAKKLALTPEDDRLAIFQQWSNKTTMRIGIGIPSPSSIGIRITMVIYQPFISPLVYHKQQLHEDEYPYFITGDEQLIMEMHSQKIAPAICFESLQPTHIAHAASLGATVYVASVAKNQIGLEKALRHYPTIARSYRLPVLMSNCIGYCDNFESVGQSAIWNSKGQVISQLTSHQEGVLTYDTATGTAQQTILSFN